MKRKGGGGGGKGTRKGNKFSIEKDPFFSTESKKRRKGGRDDDEVIESDESGDEYGLDSGGNGGDGVEPGNESPKETKAEIRFRMAKEQIEKMKGIARRIEEENDEEDGDERGSDKEGERDSLVARLLQQEQLEESGRVRKAIASRVQKADGVDAFRLLVKQRHSVTAVALSEDDVRGFSAAKDGTVLHWDVESGKSEKYRWPTEEKLKRKGVKDPQGRATKHSKHILGLAVSSDGRYMATGGLDRHVHIWDTRTREYIQAFPGHRGPVSCLSFRQGTSELFSGSFDRTVKIWNVDDKSYISTLFGHQSEVLTVDCLRKERVLTVGRDRTMQLFKVPEESRLVFRAPTSSLECCCFIGNDEFLSGSDDGSIELWNQLRKKPVYMVKNAHALAAAQQTPEFEDGGIISNGHLENGNHIAEPNHQSSVYSWVTSVAVCRGSDLAASGAGNGCVRLWSIETESKDIRPLLDLPLVGFVNSLAFANSGRFLVAGVGQEPRLGRWGCLPAARNGIAIQSLELS